MHEQSENINKEKETIKKQPNRNNRAEKYNWNIKGIQKQIWSGRRQTQKTWIISHVKSSSEGRKKIF